MAPFVARFHRAHADILTSMGRCKEGITVLEQACDHKPTSFEAWFALGTVLLTQTPPHRDLPRAAGCFQRATELNPLDADSWTNYGLAMYTMQKPVESIEAYTEAIQLTPWESKSHVGLGRAHIAAGNFSPGIHALEKAVEMAPALQTYWIYLGDGYLNAKLRAKALHAYETAAELPPNNKDLEQRIDQLRDQL